MSIYFFKNNQDNSQQHLFLKVVSDKIGHMFKFSATPLHQRFVCQTENILPHALQTVQTWETSIFVCFIRNMIWKPLYYFIIMLSLYKQHLGMGGSTKDIADYILVLCKKIYVVLDLSRSKYFHRLFYWLLCSSIVFINIFKYLHILRWKHSYPSRFYQLMFSFQFNFIFFLSHLYGLYGTSNWLLQSNTVIIVIIQNIIISFSKYQV